MFVYMHANKHFETCLCVGNCITKGKMFIKKNRENGKAETPLKGHIYNGFIRRDVSLSWSWNSQSNLNWAQNSSHPFTLQNFSFSAKPTIDFFYPHLSSMDIISVLQFRGKGCGFTFLLKRQADQDVHWRIDTRFH